MKCSGRWIGRDDCISWRFKHDLLELNRFLFIVETEGKSRAIERDFLVCGRICTKIPAQIPVINQHIRG
jgi:hypothetical protein